MSKSQQLKSNFMDDLAVINLINKYTNKMKKKKKKKRKRPTDAILTWFCEKKRRVERIYLVLLKENVIVIKKNKY